MKNSKGVVLSRDLGIAQFTYYHQRHDLICDCLFIEDSIRKESIICKSCHKFISP
jgi:hypothetical protein